MTTLRNVHILDPAANGPAPLVDVVFHDAVEAISPAAGGPVGSDVDGGGKILLPGLIDTHVHLGAPDVLRRSARAGVTTMVDLGTTPDTRIAEQRNGRGVTAFLSAGSAASAPGSTQIARMGFPAQSGVANPADAERYLDWRVRNGSDLIKIIVEDPAATDVPALDIGTITALVSGAHARGLLTVAHVVTAAAFERGLDAGVDVLTHAPLDRVLPEATLRRMLDQRTVASPTLVMMRRMATARLGDQADAAFSNALESVRALHDAGVPVVAGTDANETPMAPVPHGSSLHDEIGYLMQSGLTAREALTAATSAAADVFRLADRGRVEVGKRADLVLVDGDPLTDMSRLRAPAAVWVAGTGVA